MKVLRDETLNEGKLSFSLTIVNKRKLSVAGVYRYLL